MQRDKRAAGYNPDTRTQLLDTAERLFAAHGVEAVSVRDISREARANLGAINYHFGTLQALVVEVFQRRLVPVNRERLNTLDALEQKMGRHPLRLEEILTAFIRPALLQAADPAQGGTAFARLMGRCLGEPHPGLEVEIRRHLDPIRRRFDLALGRTLPSLSRIEIMCRMHLVIGALHHELLVMDRRPPPHMRLKRKLADIEQRLVSFAAAGLRAGT
ncbi:MAG: TetR/AcrR family transcriptional regulator [Kiritimatiellia bacterium]